MKKLPRRKLSWPAGLGVLVSAAIITSSIAWSQRGGEPVVDQRTRFGLRHYVSDGQVVGVGAAHDMLVVRSLGDASGDQVAASVEAAGLTAFAEQGWTDDGPASVEHSARRLRNHGLFLVELARPLSPELLARTAALVARASDVLQCYPVLTRATGRAFYDDHLIVHAQPGQLDAVLSKTVAALDAKLVRRSLIPDAALVAVGARFAFDAVEASRWLDAHQRMAGLRSAEPEMYRELRVTALVDDPMLSDQWHLTRSGTDVPGVGQIHVEGAWDITKGNPDVVIAVFDTGTDLRHPDLIPNLIDGFDAVDGDDDPSAACSASYDGRDAAASCPAQTPYRESHATSVCGLTAGRGDNGLGTTGVCPLCTLRPVRVIGDESSEIGSGLSSAEAFRRGVNEGAWVINNSWGIGFSRYFPLSSVERSALRYARINGRDGLGTVILFAAGNDTADVAADPYASQPDVITVAATTNLDDWAYYSNYGREIDVAAPSNGGAINEDNHGLVSTDVSGDDGYDASDYTSDFGGTSGASPIAAGLAGLILSANPALTADQVRLILTDTADKILADKVDWTEVMGQDLEEVFAYDEVGHSIAFGWGRINAEAAVRAALHPPLHGARCADADCPLCDDDGRCQTHCKRQADCHDGTICEASVCLRPVPKPTEIGQPCSTDCPYCVDGVDSYFQATSLCTAECDTDLDCPDGFDCRLTERDGPSICAVGSPNAGEPNGIRNCFDEMTYAYVLVKGDDDQLYCSDMCLSDGDGACPYGFHCGDATCTCSRQMGGQWCIEWTCEETTPQQSDWYWPLCFADTGFGVQCQIDADCKKGDYCRADGTCRIDDRQGCFACNPCQSDDECGGFGYCYDTNDDGGSRCYTPCSSAGDCPGDSVCRDVTLRRGTLRACVSPDPGSDTLNCDPDYSCSVPCRDDVPCPSGQVCDETAGTCATAPEPDAGVSETADAGTTDPEPRGCECSGSSQGLTSALALLALCALVRRHRR